MENNAILDTFRAVEGELWLIELYEELTSGRLCAWVSTFHPDRLPCEAADGKIYCGSFNGCIKVVFVDGKVWMVRLPRVGATCGECMDEKVAMEIAAIQMICEQTSIPVPKVHAWGSAADNTLGLGPFIMMDFIEGIHLGQYLQNPDEPRGPMREDLKNSDIEVLYEQMTGFMLQIFKIDFARIGSLPSPIPDGLMPTPAHPLTFKAHGILRNGGVNTFGDRHCGFSTTTEYSQYLADQDFQQLMHQKNSVYGLEHARDLYTAFKSLKATIPEFVNAKYDSGPFKLICDDFGLGNLIVRSEDDFTVVGVIDMEWSYAGPAQLFGSAPWWLLLDKPISDCWISDDDQLPEVAARYSRHLDTFVEILEKVESRTPGHESKELSTLVKWSQASGAMWLHMLLITAFHDPVLFPFVKLRQHIGEERWKDLEEKFDDAEELESFAIRKAKEREEYEAALEKLEKERKLIESGELSREEFLAKNAQLMRDQLYCPQSNSGPDT